MTKIGLRAIIIDQLIGILKPLNTQGSTAVATTLNTACQQKSNPGPPSPETSVQTNRLLSQHKAAS